MCINPIHPLGKKIACTYIFPAGIIMNFLNILKACKTISISASYKKIQEAGFCRPRHLKCGQKCLPLPTPPGSRCVQYVLEDSKSQTTHGICSMSNSIQMPRDWQMSTHTHTHVHKPSGTAAPVTDVVTQRHPPSCAGPDPTRLPPPHLTPNDAAARLQHQEWSPCWWRQWAYVMRRFFFRV